MDGEAFYYGLLRQTIMKLLAMNSLDDRYGSTYRIRPLVKELEKLGHEVQFYDKKKSFVRKLFEMIYWSATSSYEVLFIQKFNPLTILPIALGRIRGKFVVVDWDDWDTGLQKNIILSTATWFCETLGPYLPQAITTHNQFIRKKIPSSKTSMILNQGFDPDLYDPSNLWKSRTEMRKSLGYEDSDIVIGYLCTFTAGGTMDLEPLFEELSKTKNKNIHYLFIGGGELLESFIKKAESLKIQNIHFTGAVDHVKVSSYLTAMDAGLVYMREHSGNQARVSLKVIEYIASNLPIFGRVLGGTELHFGHYVEFCELENLHSRLDQLKIPITRKEHTTGLLNKFAWSTIIEDLDDYLKTLESPHATNITR